MADDPAGEVLFGEVRLDLSGGFGGDDQDEAQAHVEDVEHFLLFDIGERFQPGEDRVRLPALAVDRHAAVFGDDSDEVVGDAASRDVCEAVDRGVALELLEQADDWFGVDFGRFEESLTDCAVEFGDVGVDFQLGDLEDGFADEAVAVGVEAGGGDADHRVAGADFLTVDDLGLFDHADTEAGEVEVAGGIEVGHDGRFATHEGGSGLDAAFADALDDRRDQLGIVLGHRDVVEEEEGFGSEAEDVVDRHGNEVDADGVADA